MTPTTHFGTARELSAEQSIALLRQMLLIRRFDETALELIQSHQINGVVHPYIGQESCAVGVCSALDDGDRVISNHRGHGHCIAAGTPVDRMMAELFGRVTGCCKGQGGSMHIADFDVGMLGANGIVGAGTPMVVGAALSDKLDDNGRVSVGFFGEGATGQGLLWESINLAAVWKLPVLFVCENNGIASGTPLPATIPVARVAEIASGHGAAAATVEGNDVLEVRAGAATALEHIRAGNGPYLLECVIDRWGPHASRHAPMPDRRDPDELAQARERDPVLRHRLRLQDDGRLSDDAYEAVAADVERELREAIDFAQSSPHPDPADVLEDVYA